MTATARKMSKCLCQTFEFGTYDPDTEIDETYETGCVESTWKTFAQGHDAKLAGFLTRAELAGDEISQTAGGMRISFQNAVHAAGSISEALAAKVKYQMAAARERLAKKELREASKARKATSPERKLAEAAGVVAAAPTHRNATIKVGRWTYTASIALATGEATYTTKQGETKVATSDKYAEA